MYILYMHVDIKQFLCYIHKKKLTYILKLYLKQPRLWSVSDFIFLALAH